MPGESEIIEELVVAVIDSLPEGEESSWWRRLLRFSFLYILPIIPLVYFLILLLGKS